jgi:prepilin-type N-terminal cleavage/methylation domain-containing protein
MTSTARGRHRSQAGYTLIELVIATALGVVVMGALTSVVLTGAMAANSATSRVEASAQIRNFELTAYDDFVLSHAPAPGGCTFSSPCTTQELVLQGVTKPSGLNAPPPRTVIYFWDAGQQAVKRQVGDVRRTVATNVTRFGWYVEGPTVVVRLTVKVSFYNTSNAQSQTLRFYPRVTP